MKPNLRAHYETNVQVSLGAVSTTDEKGKRVRYMYMYPSFFYLDLTYIHVPGRERVVPLLYLPTYPPDMQGQDKQGKNS